MKKIFTFILAAVLCVGSSWGATYEIGTGGTTSSNETVPIAIGNTIYYSITQQLYLASELTSAGASADDITAIGFYYNTTGYSYTRSIEVWIMTTTSDNVDSSGSDKWFMSANKDKDKSAGTKVFDGSITLPTEAGWYTIDLDNKFAWDGSKNLIITVYDKTGTKASSFARKHKVFTASKVRSLTASGSSTYKTNDTYDIKGTVSTTVPVIQFTFGSATPTPSLTASSDITDFGTFAREYETQTATITVTGENLTEDVTISAGTGLSVTPTSLTKEAVMAQGGATVTVTTTADFVSGSKVTISGNSISKEITFTGEEAQFVNKDSYTFLYNTEVGSYSSLVGSTTIESVDNSANTFVIGSGSYACTIDYSAVPGTYVALGKVSNLKVKKTGTGTFKAFAFDYSVSGITISETNEKNNITYGTVTNVTLKRTLVADGYYSTICLPFAVTAAQIAEQFGEGTKVQDLTEATLSDNDMTLTLTFTEVEAMEAGKPYLILPTEGGSEFTFNNVTLTNAVAPVEFANLHFIGTFNQSTLETGFKNTLLLGGNNELGWANNSGAFKGLRAYFRVIYHNNQAPERLSTRMLFNNTEATTNLIGIKDNQPTAKKVLLNNQLYIINNGKKYNTLGLETK